MQCITLQKNVNTAPHPLPRKTTAKKHLGFYWGKKKILVDFKGQKASSSLYFTTIHV